MMKLSEREKFVVHFMAASIYGIHENASDCAIDSAIIKLTKARCPNLSFDDIGDLSDAILQEAINNHTQWCNNGIDSYL